jgi:hypothetical protein
MSIRLRAKGSTTTRRVTLAVVIVLVSTGAAEAWRHVGALSAVEGRHSCVIATPHLCHVLPV